MTANPKSNNGTPAGQLRAYITKLDARNQSLFRSVRAAVRKRFPTANELVYDYASALVVGYSPTDRGIDAAVAIRADAKGVALYFNQGRQLPDPQRLLRGSGNQTRFLQLEAAGQLAHADVEALFSAAISRATVPFPAEEKGRLIIKSDGEKKRSLRTIST